MAEELPATVLVVEDDPGVSRLQQMRLERAGYKVRAATTAVEALDIVKKGDVDLMLIDQNLPGGANGLELYAQVKEAGFDIPAILVTGFAGDSIVLQSFRAGVFDFVPKTTDYLDYLLPTIERVLKKRRIEFQLVDSEARLSSVIRSALDAILTVDEHQNIRLCNPAAEQMFGVACPDVIGRPMRNLLPDWSSEPDAGEQIHRWETNGRRVDGTLFPVELSMSWVEANKRGFWTVVARDISERKRAEEARLEFIREHAARREAEAARERIELVANENNRLYLELRRVDRLKDEFLAMLAHELRNPLAPIRNALHLIQMEGQGVPQMIAENWGIIDRQVTHLVRLVDDLLDVSRISQGKIQLQIERLNLNQIINRAVESSRPLIAARRHTFSLQLPDEALAVDGDMVRLVQVLSNLLNNAAKYTPEGGKIVLIVEQQDKQAILRVRDTGVGIPPEMLPRLFDLFTQSERTLDRADGGLGIGLTLVKRLTEMHSGSVDATSEGSGKGSEFLVRLPVADGPAPVAPPTATPVQQPITAPRRRVLLVEDSPDSVRTLTRLLQLLGHEVRSATNGTDALTVAVEMQPEVVLLDIGLPGMDGYEVSRRLRSQPQFNQTILVALTGYGSPEDRLQSQKAGFNAHLVKPVDLEALKQLLAQPLTLLRTEAAQ